MHAHVQRLLSVVKMVTVLEECTTKQQTLGCAFFVDKRTQCKDIHKEIFRDFSEKSLSPKGFATG
jgi:uncharacterized protein YutD